LKQILTILSIIVTCNCFAGNKYVSKVGSDVTGNGSINNPYKTLDKASTFLNPGDTLFVRGGIYANINFNNGDMWKDESTVRISNLNGTASKYIVIMPYNNESVTFKGDATFIFLIRTSAYVVIKDFEIYGEMQNIPLDTAIYYQFAYRSGTNTEPTLYRLPRYTNTNQSNLPNISAQTIYRPSKFNTHGFTIQSSHHIEVYNLHIHHMPGEGFRYGGSDYIKIIGNDIHDNAQRSSGGVHGISCYGLTSIDANDSVKILLARNKVYNNWQTYPSWSEQKTIFTAVIDEGKGMTVQRTNSTASNWLHGRIRFENNVTYNNGLSGIHINDGDRVDIVNNTCYKNSHTGSGSNIGISVQGGNDVKVYNNIVEADLSFGGYSISVGSVTGLDVKYNLINGGLDPTLTLNATKSTKGVANFVDSANKDFHLQSTSLAINKGDTGYAPKNDYDNKIRDNKPDLGAYEYFAPLALNNIELSGQLNNQIVTLKWQVNCCKDVVVYVVEHFVNNEWKAVYEIANTNKLPYQQTTFSLKNINANNLFKIKCNCINGSIYYSNIIQLNGNVNNKLVIYPNPSSSYITVNSKNLLQNNAIKIFDVLGKEVSGKTTININQYNAFINISNLEKGIYFFINNNNTISSFIKQ